MSKKIKKKQQQGQQRTYTFKSSASFCECQIPQTDAKVHLRKPRESVRQDMLNATPNLHHAIELTSAIVAGEDVSIDEIVIPGREFAQLAEYMAQHTVALEGVYDDHGVPIQWALMPEDDRVLFYETLPSDGLMVLYGSYLTHIALDHNPRLVEKYAKAAGAQQEG